MRVQGGTMGLISALLSGRVEINGTEPAEIGWIPFTEREHRARNNRIERARKRRAKKLARNRPL